jgi:cytochrome P460
MWRATMWARVVLLVGALSIGSAAAQSPLAVPYPQRYQTALVKYAVVDRVDGLSRDLYASPDATDAMRRDPSLKEFPVGVLFALDVYRARMTGHDRKTGSPIFEAGADGHLVRSQTERTLHLMRKSQPGFGSQNWTFGGFDPLTAEPLKLQLPGDCLLCHQAAVTSDMSFSLSLLRRFVMTGTVQYRFCAQPGRQSCAF